MVETGRWMRMCRSKLAAPSPERAECVAATMLVDRYWRYEVEHHRERGLIG